MQGIETPVDSRCQLENCYCAATSVPAVRHSSSNSDLASAPDSADPNADNTTSGPETTNGSQSMMLGPNEGSHNRDDRSNFGVVGYVRKVVCKGNIKWLRLRRESDTNRLSQGLFGSIRSFFKRERLKSNSGNNDHSSEDKRDCSETDFHDRSHEEKMLKWKEIASGEWENMLVENIVNTDSICPNYKDIFVDLSTIQKLENVTSLSLRRPKAFGHGVLRSNRITGSIIYGPPGTGKSLLCRCLAKQSGLNMISVSAAELWQKCFGDDEKVIKALFSLARKLHPCIVFIDEADAMFGARKAGEQRHIRSGINQFLMEWDGLVSDLKAPFILLATNRPFDLDPAVLRRAPVHIHMDLPTPEERMGIVKLLLEGETLASDIDASVIAKMTARFSGSDLKSLCVQAALECVGEQSDDTDIRIIERRHFVSALHSIRATGMTKTTANQFEIFGKHARNQEPGEEE